jgi:hypothetical protein
MESNNLGARRSGFSLTYHLAKILPRGFGKLRRRCAKLSAWVFAHLRSISTIGARSGSAIMRVIERVGLGFQRATAAI